MDTIYTYTEIQKQIKLEKTRGKIIFDVAKIILCMSVHIFMTESLPSPPIY